MEDVYDKHVGKKATTDRKKVIETQIEQRIAGPINVDADIQ